MPGGFTTHFVINGERPSDVKMDALTNLKFGKDIKSGAEKKHFYKRTLICMGLGIICFYLQVIFDFYFLTQIKVDGLMVFAAVCFWLYGMTFLLKLARGAHKTQISKAFKWMWLVSVMGDDVENEPFGDVTYSTGTMRRMLPEGTGFDEVKYGLYVSALRNEILNASNEINSSLIKDGWSPIGAKKEIRSFEDKTITDSLHEVHGIVRFENYLSQTNRENMTFAVIELHVIQYYVKAGKYWYPYDITPKYIRLANDELLKKMI